MESRKAARTMCLFKIAHGTRIPFTLRMEEPLGAFSLQEDSPTTVHGLEAEHQSDCGSCFSNLGLWRLKANMYTVVEKEFDEEGRSRAGLGSEPSSAASTIHMAQLNRNLARGLI